MIVFSDEDPGDSDEGDIGDGVHGGVCGGADGCDKNRKDSGTWRIQVNLVAIFV